jgi:hypothetical protein
MFRRVNSYRLLRNHYGFMCQSLYNCAEGNSIIGTVLFISIVSRRYLVLIEEKVVCIYVRSVESML